MSFSDYQPAVVEDWRNNNEPVLAEEWDLESDPDDFVDAEFVEEKEREALIHTKLTDFVDYGINVADQAKNKIVPFRFLPERRYLLRPYDTSYRRVLLKCARQTEKCGYQNSSLLTEEGRPVLLRDVRVGDVVLGMGTDGTSTASGCVTWKSELLQKPCVRLRTRQGHEVVVALTHPMRTWDAWTESAEFHIKDRLAVVRQAGEFTGKVDPHDYEVVLLVYMIAEGHTPDAPWCMFTQNEDGPVLQEFLDIIVDRLGDVFNPNERKRGCWQLRFGKASQLQALVEDWGLRGHLSATKLIPDFVYDLDQYQTALFLNRLWAGDRHGSHRDRAYALEYDTVSERLSRGVQRLLWKFGIPTSFRRWKPRLYEGTDKWAYKLRVETAEGVRRFLHDIGALGKSEDIPPPNVEDENNNRDTYPIEIAEDLKAIHCSRRGYQRRGRYVPQPSLRSAGLREKPQYPPSRRRLQEYVDFFRSDPEFDQELTDRLSAHLDTDLYWDEVIEITYVGKQPCYDIAVEGTDSFIADGFITHNSTMLGNKMLSLCCLNSSYKCLYVSPTHTQTNTFSRDRLAEPINISPVLASWTTTKMWNNLHLKKFINHSQITLRYAYHNADRTRGVPADAITIDEVQDILLANIPVIEECASHSTGGLFTYSGTPKSLDNPLEHYWSYFSTQNEWMVPCERHGTPKNPRSWHWNILQENNIGAHGTICDRCGAPIDPRHPMAQWVSLNPNPDIPDPFEGYRIPQLMVPWLEWTDILQKQKFYPRVRFYNEVMGLSYDSGVRPITRQQLHDICDEKISMSSDGLAMLRTRVGAGRFFMGIDWAGGSEHSFTVVSLGTYLPSEHTFTVFYVHRFDGAESEPQVQLDYIKRLINTWNVEVVGCDYGGGYWPNTELIRTFGNQRVVRFQYSQPSEKIRWEPGMMRFLVNRTAVMADFFNALKRQDQQVIRLPNWKEFKDPYGTDFTNIFCEYNERTRQDEFKLSPETTDDACHSVLYCLLASTMRIQRPDIFVPQKVE